MSGYLWGIAQLVNDPSNELIKVIRKRILSKSSEITTNVTTIRVNSHKSKSSETFKTDKSKDSKESSLKDFSVSAEPVLDVKSSASDNHRNVVVQTPTVKREYVAVQYQKPKNAYLCKATSMLDVSKLDCSTTTSYLVLKQNAETKPMKQNVCTDHQQAFIVLKHWSNCRKIEEKHINRLKAIKSKIKHFFNAFKMEKIQSLSTYDDSECTKTFKLYRQASIESLNKIIYNT